MEKLREFINLWRSGATHIVAHTSGSTGNPKEILLSRQVIERSAQRTNTFFNITATSRLHLCLSCDYIAGKMMAVRAETAGALLTAEPPSNAPTLCGSDSPIRLLAVVPSQLESLLENPKLKMVENILVGGSPIPGPLRHRLAQCGVKAWESYGMTETASHIALRPVTIEPQPFHLLPDIQCQVGPQGNLIVFFEGERLETNDAAVMTGIRDFNILGRMDNVIISGGIKIHPEQLEQQAADILAPYPSYFTSVSDNKWGERLILVIEAPQEITVEEKQQLLQRLRQRLGPKLAPKQITVVNTLPRTASGKIIRRKNIIFAT